MSDINNNKPAGDSRTLIAVILSVLIITAGVVINDKFFPTKPAAQPQATSAAPVPAPAANPAVPAAVASGIRPADTAFVATPTVPSAAAPLAPAPAAQKAAVAAIPEQTYAVSTDLLEAVLTNRGGNLLSLKLKKHKDSTESVNLILPGQIEAPALGVSFDGSTPLDSTMSMRMLDPTTIEFSRTFLADVVGKSAPVPFVYRKVFTFHNGEYLFGMAIALENSVNEPLPLNTNGSAYTLSFAPQIGPHYNPASKNSDYRKVQTYVDGKKRDEKTKPVPTPVKGQPAWIGIGGKYFVFLEVPEVNTFSVNLATSANPVLGPTTRIDLNRPAIATSKQVDTYYFYFGPKTSAELSRYNYAKDNAFGKADLHLENAADSSNILGWLEAALKFALNIFFKIIPNYGVAIILVTLLVKIILFPLTKKGSLASAHMAEVQPKIQAIQAKYKGNPEKLNKEMAEFYKTEGMNPMSGCLPLLIQFPIFIAMYNLFNTHFDLRGALFIPGWIPDLSMPESIWNFGTFKLPLLGWNDLRLLPIIYLVSQLVYGKFTQQPASGQTANQMKIMMFGMPIVFFFILYDVPSGLLVYWIASNLLTIVQQIVINDILKTRKKNLALKK